MPCVQPYKALFFFDADNHDEVRGQWPQAYDDDGFLAHLGEKYVRVTVIACEFQYAMEWIWFIRDGLLERRPSWMFRYDE